MWARHMELMLGIWLALQPFVLGYEPGRTGMWVHDLSCAALVATVALAAHWAPLRRIHLLLLPLAAWLVAAGWWQTWGAGMHPHPAYQAWILVGLMLAMFAIVPSDASRPPDPWRRAGGGRASESEEVRRP